mmetsp:Transcript_67426/g.140888  ORF Transcript_67426/g.140888 Transcript_67426/m.140888 type:complete len:364 (-) Transcript_67426:318-1409(-)|eukprot:CAMPEP_0206433320 /NCGR_PEP_ID=MMETSP0324_2-20121206/8463_1 /ASSEMBLY_ACC=CAM_ASM_000836 /TAXON_ID=2866 /ORGANISM="Crypthecodinium cohnii, Strain Seligo" /LENGTH=363 /DNA_ID=CAMNT_0053899563 /DNA_START=330 /DNA_END=1421 /DNA_ORIENTATION=-
MEDVSPARSLSSSTASPLEARSPDQTKNVLGPMSNMSNNRSNMSNMSNSMSNITPSSTPLSPQNLGPLGPRGPRKVVKLTVLRSLALHEELNKAKFTLEQARAKRIMRAKHQEEEEERERAAEAARDQRKLQQESRRKAATFIQAAWRMLHVMHTVVPDLLEAKRLEELEAERVQLKGTLLNLRRTMHGLVFLEAHQVEAATKLQAWWRGILCRRAVQIFAVRRKLLMVLRSMESAAIMIQSRMRGKLCRLLRLKMKEEQRNREMQKMRDYQQLRIRMAIRIQSWVRGVYAKLDLDRRRLHMSLELMTNKDLNNMSNSQTQPAAARQRNSMEPNRTARPTISGPASPNRGLPGRRATRRRGMT